MDEREIKNIDNQKPNDFGHILHQLERIERIYPYYSNMLKNHISDQSSIENNINSIMKKESKD
jgi:hypothetical protein